MKNSRIRQARFLLSFRKFTRMPMLASLNNDENKETANNEIIHVQGR